MTRHSDMSVRYDKIKLSIVFFVQAEDGIRDLVRSRGLGDVYKRQARTPSCGSCIESLG